ncbi:MAG: hypothetical protein LBT03_03825 [Holosporales bacterium]|nr:hypothetical protein [Holosporales bacterium]
MKISKAVTKCKNYKMLANAAKCRAEADWLIGINGTRAITMKISSIISKYWTTTIPVTGR